MSHKPRICLVEPCHSHEEVLFPLIDLLRKEYDVHVIAPQSLLDVDILCRTRQLYTAISIRWNPKASRWRRLFRMPGKYREIRRIVDSIKPECVLFNSTYGWLDLLLIAVIFRGIPKAQIIHEFQLFLRPGMRWLYKQFVLNLVLSEQVCRYVKARHPEFSSLDYVLPIFFDGFIKGGGITSSSVQRDSDCLKLGVFGSIETGRRNYRGLLDAIKQSVAISNASRFRVYLVGKAPLSIQREVMACRLEGVVELYSEYVSFQKMFQLLKEMDLILFLIDGTVRNARHYNRYKITGTSTLIKAFKKVGVSSTDFLVDETLADRCFFYTGTDIAGFLKKINDGDISVADIRNKKASCEDASEFSFERQQARLVSLLQRGAPHRRGLRGS